MTELSDPHIREAVAAADRLREQLGLGTTAPFERDLLACMEGELRLAVCILDLPEVLAGAYLRRHQRSFVFIDSSDFPTRQRFTIAHELGHHCLGHGAVFENYKDVGRDTPVLLEQQANYFASELLCPLSAVQHWLEVELDGAEPDLSDVVRLAAHFHVSPPMMLYRLSKGEFPAVSRGLLTRLWNRVNIDRAHIAIAEELGVGHGEDRVSELYDEQRYPRLPDGVEPAAAELISERVRKLFPPAASGADGDPVLQQQQNDNEDDEKL